MKAKILFAFGYCYLWGMFIFVAYQIFTGIFG